MRLQTQHDSLGRHQRYTFFSSRHIELSDYNTAEGSSSIYLPGHVAFLAEHVPHFMVAEEGEHGRSFAERKCYARGLDAH